MTPSFLSCHSQHRTPYQETWTKREQIMLLCNNCDCLLWHMRRNEWNELLTGWMNDDAGLGFDTDITAIRDTDTAVVIRIVMHRIILASPSPTVVFTNNTWLAGIKNPVLYRDDAGFNYFDHLLSQIELQRSRYLENDSVLSVDLQVRNIGGVFDDACKGSSILQHKTWLCVGRYVLNTIQHWIILVIHHGNQVHGLK